MTVPASPGSSRLARRILEAEGGARTTDGDQAAAAARALGRLHCIVLRLVGEHGARALELRALHRAAEVHGFLEAAIAEGRLGEATDSGVPGIDGHTMRQVADGLEAVLVQLLDLLVTFLGKDLRDRLVTQEWQDLSNDPGDGAKESVMNENEAEIIRRLHTGVPGLDAVLAGGLPEYSFNLIAGQPGTGKTTLAHQIMFASAGPDRRALYFTVLGEPTLKMLRYQQQFSFFDLDKLGDTVHFANLSDAVLRGDLDAVHDEVVRHVEEVRPGIVMVDSFRTMVRAVGSVGDGEVLLQNFVQRLALSLTTWEATTFLVGEYSDREVRGNPVFTIADGIIWLHQEVHENSVVRKLQVMKLRGQAPTPGLHSFRITAQGLRVFPRIVETPASEVRPRRDERMGTGVAELDEMMGSGIPAGDAVLVSGPAGSGKTLLATQFITEGIERGEAGVIVVFEEFPEEYLERAKRLGMDPAKSIEDGKLIVIRLRPLDLSVDEVLQEIQSAVRSIDAQRVVIDSLSGFEVGLAPTYRAEIRDSLYRMVSSLTASGVTVLMTTESTEAFAPPHFTPQAISFLTDDIIVQRFIELNGYIERVIGVVKMRRSSHSRALRLYDVTPEGLVIGRVLRGYHGIVTGIPILRATTTQEPYAGLTGTESAVLRALAEVRQGTIEVLEHRTGIAQGELAPILERLMQLRYVSERTDDGTTHYRFEA